MGNLPSTVLPCNDACERAKRNRRLAEALDIDTTSVTVSSSSASLVEYSDVLLRHAYTNPTWVKHAEEAFAAFVQDSGRRVFHFPSGKGAGNPFLLELAKHYDLSASIIDADRKGLASVTVRKTAAKTATIPPLLLSTAVAAWKPTTGSSTASSSKPNVSKSLTATHHREPINALHLASLQFGMDARDLQLLLEPIFVCGNDVAITVKMITDHDAVMLAESSRRSTLSVDDIEALLVGVESEVRNKFVANNWAKDVTLCHASPSGEVILGSKPKASQAMGPGAARAAYAASVRKDVPVTNTYISLSAAPATAAMKTPHLAPKSSGQSRPPSPAPPPPPAPARGERPVTPAPPRPSTPEDWDQESNVLSPVEVPRPIEAVAPAGTGST
ncbi:hypothetical protein PhCBS80983_g03608 [Powellomyces hirtus]|uniref:R3H domain-containing protein n=1 Tax=Powellomyces hirtus TaxID=109895 RepID=A0A507E3R8_9FUNG|nr:hypothetical protein PhCBS80983_g03608 [Powellomyces hirtus]